MSVERCRSEQREHLFDNLFTLAEFVGGEIRGSVKCVSVSFFFLCVCDLGERRSLLPFPPRPLSAGFRLRLKDVSSARSE